MKKVYFVHGDVAYSNNCRATLEAAGFDVELYRSGDRAYEAFCRVEPAAIVLNMSDDNLDGIQFMQKVRRVSTVPVVLLTDSAEEFDEVLGLRLGADTVLRKPASAFLVTEWVKPLVRRHKMMAEAETRTNPMVRKVQTGDLAMLPDRVVAIWKGHELPLTVSEFKLLAGLASRPGIVKSREALLDLIHDHADYVDDRSIDSHVKRIRSKIRDIDPEFNCIEAVYGMGYRYVVPAAPKMPPQIGNELIPFPVQIAG
jgi:two-component system, OmpR family, response regulator ChvI